MRAAPLALPLGFLLLASTFACSATPAAATKESDVTKSADDEDDDDKDTDAPAASTPAPAPSATAPAPMPPVPAANIFLDDFARPDGALGNGWVERAPGLYRLTSGTAEQFRVGRIDQLLVLRPAVEDASDVDVSVDITSGTDFMDPGVFARASVDAQGMFSGYSLFLDGGGAVMIDRANGSRFTPIASARLSRRLVPGESCHLAFKVTGTTTVKLEGTVTDKAGAVLGQLSATDSAVEHLLRGSVGFGSSDAAFTQYDNFKRETLAP